MAGYLRHAALACTLLAGTAFSQQVSQPDQRFIARFFDIPNELSASYPAVVGIDIINTRQGHRIGVERVATVREYEVLEKRCAAAGLADECYGFAVRYAEQRPSTIYVTGDKQEFLDHVSHSFSTNIRPTSYHVSASTALRLPDEGSFELYETVVRELNLRRRVVLIAEPTLP